MQADSSAVSWSDVRAVFFDFGDTLAVLSPTREELFTRAARSIGLMLEIEAVRRAYQVVDFHTKYSSVHVTDRASFYQNYNEQLCEALGISGHFDSLSAAISSEFKTNKKWRLMDEVPEVLESLRERGLRLAIVANWDSNLSELAEQLGVKEFFSSIVPSQAAGVEKPDPAIFLRAAEELALQPQTDTILYVGNEYRADVMGARAAGLYPVLIDRFNLYPHADCPRFASLLQWLERMESAS